MANATPDLRLPSQASLPFDLYCLVTEAHIYEYEQLIELAQGRHLPAERPRFEPATSNSQFTPPVSTRRDGRLELSRVGGVN